MFYSHNVFGGVSSNIAPAEGYTNEHAALEVMAECYQNDLKLFEAALYTDFQESAMIHEGASEESLVAMQEGAIGDFFKRIKDLFKKLIAKVKAIFRAFMAKFDSVFMKSNKEFVNKYKVEVQKKDLSDLEVKYSKSKDRDFIRAASVSIGLNGTATEKQVEDFDMDEEVCRLINDMVGNGFKISDPKDFEKEYHEHCYDDEEEVKASTIITSIIATLSGQDDLIKRVEKANKNLEDTLGKVVKAIEKQENDFYKMKDADKKTANINLGYTSTDKASASVAGGSVGGKLDVKYKQATLQMLSKSSSAMQTAVTKVTAGALREAKFQGTQARRIMAKAVGYKAWKAEGALLEAIEDAALYEAETDFR